MEGNIVIIVLIIEILRIGEAFVLNINNNASYYKIKDIIPNDYIKEIRPPTHRGSSLEVGFSIIITDINAINVDNLDFEMNVIIKQEWQDIRINIPEEIFESDDEYLTMPKAFLEKLWQPDLYFLNANTEVLETLTHKFSSVKISRNSTVKYTARVRVTVSCQMEFQQYPVDIQECPLNVESLAYNNRKVALKWLKNGVVMNSNLILLQYNILPTIIYESNEYSVEKEGNYSRLVAYFKFKRQIGHHLIQTFAPSTLVVVLSWFSFWLDLDAVPARVTLIVTSMLTLITMFTDLREDLPAVAYIKALDIWMAGCTTSVFGAVAEFTLVKVLCVKYNELKERESHISKQISALTSWSKQPALKNFQLHREVPKFALLPLYWINDKGHEKIMWKEIDRISRVIFPFLFFLFATIYWSILL